MQRNEFPQGGIRQFLWFLRWNFVQIVGLNLLFLLTCLPVVTIPAACCGLTGVLCRWVRGLPAATVGDYFREFRQQLVGRFCLWAVQMIAPLSIAWYLEWFGILRDAALVRLLGYGLVCLIQCWWFPVMALVEVPAWAALKNAVILMALEWKHTLRLLLSVVALYGLLLFFPLYLIPVGVVCFLP